MKLLLAAKALGRGLSTSTVPSKDTAIKIDVINGRRRSICIAKNLLIFIKHDDVSGNYLRSQDTVCCFNRLRLRDSSTSLFSSRFKTCECGYAIILKLYTTRSLLHFYQ